MGCSRLSISGTSTILTLDHVVPVTVLAALVGGPVNRLLAHPLLLSPDYIVEEAVDLGAAKCRLTLGSVLDAEREVERTSR